MGHLYVDTTRPTLSIWSIENLGPTPTVYIYHLPAHANTRKNTLLLLEMLQFISLTFRNFFSMDHAH